MYLFIFLFDDTVPTYIYTLSLHDALPILLDTFLVRSLLIPALTHDIGPKIWWPSKKLTQRSEEHTSELQSRGHLVCRLLLEKKKKKKIKVNCRKTITTARMIIYSTTQEN